MLACRLFGHVEVTTRLEHGDPHPDAPELPVLGIEHWRCERCGHEGMRSTHVHIG